MWRASEGWRRGRDSNPWYPSGYNGFQDRRLKPLGHLSTRLRAQTEGTDWVDHNSSRVFYD
jgi:hypothetical protein